MVYTEKIPIRLSAEVVEAVDEISTRLNKIPKGLSLFIIQSKHDTMTDPEASQRFYEQTPVTDKKIVLLDYGWHFLSREPGYMATLRIALSWILDRTL